ncbi:MAG TPA: glycoside hydrolase family 15 protein, partial [Candidatus Acidoferrum sp.]|nr:glycoside hydrolase family 15 protein [Candidatus Acidoferrum sp.]
PLRSLIYLATSQSDDGSFAQNFWVDGTPFWSGIQLDEVAFPILLAHRLWRSDGLRDFDPYPMVLKAAAYLIRQGPATRQERWEEAGGYSPSTLAALIAALVCAANFAAHRGDADSAQLILQVADWLEQNIEAWTVTNEGTLLDGARRHYVRLNPFEPGQPLPTDDAGRLALTVNNRAEGLDRSYPAREIVDAGFLELVRYGIRAADDPVIRDSIRVVDATLKVETPSGTCWRRYNNDGYGQREDGGPFVGAGKGRGWPLLTGERGHYELAAGKDVGQYIRWLEGFATPTHLIPEQIWDEDDRPEQHLKRGRPTGGAVPLLWAHAEYIKLLRSVRDGRVYDLIPEVADRYIRNRRVLHKIQFWSFRHPSRSVKCGSTLRIHADNAFRIHFSTDDWATATDIDSTSTNLGIDYCDIPIPGDQRVPLRFTFFWIVANLWEDGNFEVACTERDPGSTK